MCVCTENLTIDILTNEISSVELVRCNSWDEGCPKEWQFADKICFYIELHVLTISSVPFGVLISVYMPPLVWNLACSSLSTFVQFSNYHACVPLKFILQGFLVFPCHSLQDAGEILGRKEDHFLFLVCDLNADTDTLLSVSIKMLSSTLPDLGTWPHNQISPAVSCNHVPGLSHLTSDGVMNPNHQQLLLW